MTTEPSGVYSEEYIRGIYSLSLVFWTTTGIHLGRLLFSLNIHCKHEISNIQNWESCWDTPYTIIKVQYLLFYLQVSVQIPVCPSSIVSTTSPYPNGGGPDDKDDSVPTTRDPVTSHNLIDVRTLNRPTPNGGNLNLDLTRPVHRPNPLFYDQLISSYLDTSYIHLHFYTISYSTYMIFMLHKDDISQFNSNWFLWLYHQMIHL